FSQHAVFTSGLVLLLHILSAKLKGLRADPSREMAHVHKCMEAIRFCESRRACRCIRFLECLMLCSWQGAGMLW
ncbi:hypothetical protein B0H14DRAFT_2382920, partial [Mycena olivaceomarginata]